MSAADRLAIDIFASMAFISFGQLCANAKFTVIINVANTIFFIIKSLNGVEKIQLLIRPHACIALHNFENFLNKIRCIYNRVQPLTASSDCLNVNESSAYQVVDSDTKARRSSAH
jgi:hypothetical protein